MGQKQLKKFGIAFHTIMVYKKKELKNYATTEKESSHYGILHHL